MVLPSLIILIYKYYNIVDIHKIIIAQFDKLFKGKIEYKLTFMIKINFQSKCTLEINTCCIYFESTSVAFILKVKDKRNKSQTYTSPWGSIAFNLKVK